MVIVYGGSFNPPSLAHLQLAQRVLQEPQGEKIIFLPVGNDYNKPELIDCQHRIAMLELILATEKQMFVSALECQDENFKGSYFSLLALQKIYGQREIAFLLGADHLPGLPFWIEGERLLTEFKIWAMPRPGYPLREILRQQPLLNKYKENIRFLPDYPLLNISSTAIRQALKENKEEVFGLDDKIHEYIKQHGLYRGEME